MKIHQISIRDMGGEHQGYSYHSSRGAAAIAEGKARENGFETERKEIKMEISKAGILHVLNCYGGHADNG